MTYEFEIVHINVVSCESKFPRKLDVALCKCHDAQLISNKGSQSYP
jgi:hypothetical protein